MNYRQFNTHIEIVRTVIEKDGDGFSLESDIVLANVRAYREKKHGSKFWASKVAVFARADVLFQLRRIPGLELDTTMVIVCGRKRHEILHVDDDRGRGMYIDVLTRSIEPSKGGA